MSVQPTDLLSDDDEYEPTDADWRELIQTALRLGLLEVVGMRNGEPVYLVTGKEYDPNDPLINVQ